MVNPPQTSDPLIYALWMLGFVVVSVLTHLNNRHTRRMVAEVKADTEATVSQTVNEHTITAYPNLRDEVTSIRRTVETVKAEQSALASELIRHYEEADADRANTKAALAALGAERERAIARMVAEHDAKYPHGH